MTPVVVERVTVRWCKACEVATEQDTCPDCDGPTVQIGWIESLKSNP